MFILKIVGNLLFMVVIEMLIPPQNLVVPTDPVVE